MKTPSGPPDGIAALRDEITAYSRAATEALVERYCPGFRVPGYFAGYHTQPWDVADLLYQLVNLRQLGVTQVCGEDSLEVMPRLLAQVDGPSTKVFYSYRVAESLLALGGIDSEAVRKAGLDRENLVQSVDSTDIFDPETRELRGLPNNYWGVLAFCEFRRQQLGLLPSTEVLDFALERAAEVMFRNPTGFFDDDRAGNGRYDTYTADVHLMLEPMFPLLEARRLEHNLRAHVRQLECLAMENGAYVTFGRSNGALSVLITLKLGALALKYAYAEDPARMLGLVRNAFQHIQSWSSDDLTNAHRGRMTDQYRGVHRLLQMTLDNLSKLSRAALTLGAAAERPEYTELAATSEREVLFPPRDVWFPFEPERPTGFWMFRNRDLAFQLALVDRNQADYVAWLRGPGLFENPVDSPMVCGVPRVGFGELDYFPIGIPRSFEKIERGVRFAHEKFVAAGWPEGQVAPHPCRRETEIRVEGDCVVGQERWTFGEAPLAITFDIPESTRALEVRIETDCDHHLFTVETEGMAEWRSCWNTLRRVHQVSFVPAREITFTWRVRPSLRVAFEPSTNDYTKALYEAMPPRVLDIRGLRPGLHLREHTVKSLVGDADIIHIGWPEHWFTPHGLGTEEFDSGYLALLEELGRSPVKVVWTMHNRRPHNSTTWGEGRGERLFYALAEIADGLIHHSHWGMEYMRREMPYKPGALHRVIPHAHFGEQMRVRETREELEAKFGLAPTAIRFGVLGRAQKEKQVELIARAFMRAGRPDQQLFITAHPINVDVSRDPRITLAERPHRLSREEIAEHVHLCDCLVSAHTGETYLTSGTVGDSIGAGIPMLANDWEFFTEILGDTGLYHTNTEDDLTRAFAEVSAAEIAEKKAATLALRPRFGWDVTARETADFLREVHQAGR